MRLHADSAAMTRCTRVLILLLVGIASLGPGALPAAATTDRSPGAMQSAELISATRDAVEELNRLRAKATADREAFERNESDIRRAIEELDKPLPRRPESLVDDGRFDRDRIVAQLELAEIFRKAWRQRGERYRRSAETLGALEKQSASIRETHERLFDRIVALRPILIEAQRRIDGREIGPEQFALEDGAASVSEWITASADLDSRRGEILRQLDELIARLASAKETFAFLPMADAEAEREVRAIDHALAGIAEASSAAEEAREELDSLRAETLPRELDQIVQEWRNGRAALEQLAGEVRVAERALLDTLAERDALAAPRLEDIDEGTGLAEVRDARRRAELSARMIGYYERDLALHETADGQRRALQSIARGALESYAAFNRQVARVWAAVDAAENVELSEDALIRDITHAQIWQSWRETQADEFATRDLNQRITEELLDEEALAAERAQLEEEKLQARQAQIRLETELSYAEFVNRMQDEPDEDLLAMLSDDGEIARRLSEIAIATEPILSRIDDAVRLALDTLRAAESLETPYSSKVIRERSSDRSRIRSQLTQLRPGDLPPDDRETAPSKKGESPRPRFPDELFITADKSLADLAAEESKYLGSEQEFARVFLDYGTNMRMAHETLEATLAEYRSATALRDARFEERLQEEKQRYAAAREIRRRIDSGTLDRTRAPADLNRWLAREGIRKTSADANRFARADATFTRRLEYEIERFDHMTLGVRWARIRSTAADARAKLVGAPVAHLTAALTPLDELDDIDRKNLEYRAGEDESANQVDFRWLIEGFTDASEQERFRTPLATYYLELANNRRVIGELESASVAYTEMTRICMAEKEDLAPASEAIAERLEQTRFEYDAARYAGAIAVHPDRRNRLEEAFREEHGRDLPYRLIQQEGDIDAAAEQIFVALARLIAQRQLAEDLDRFLSKLGIEQEIGWYQSQIARIRSQLEVQQGRQTDLEERIDNLTEIYHERLRGNALRGAGMTAMIPLFAFFFVALLRRMATRFETRVVQRNEEENSDRQRRLQTLSKTSTAAITVLVWTVALIYVFARLGLDITPIVASASVVGLAVAFGAQALIRDFFSGFFILIENQFTIGDVVKLGAISGTVERISLRITVLRDLKGVVHYIPNGSIGQVSNMTQGWSRVVMEVAVAHGEDPDRAARILDELLLEMAADEKWKDRLIDAPMVAGVENITDRSVDIRIMIKTKPGMQWGVAREARMRIKKRFNELGIKVPDMHRLVHHVYEDGLGGKVTPTADGTASNDAPSSPPGGTVTGM